MTEQIPHIRDLQRIALFRGNRNILVQLCTTNLHIDSRIAKPQGKETGETRNLFIIRPRICINGTTWRNPSELTVLRGAKIKREICENVQLHRFCRCFFC